MTAEKPTIVLVHGACSQPGHFDAWRAFFAAAGYDVMVPALPGHAPSDLAVLRRQGVAGYLAAIREVVTALDRPPVVIGHSVGGLIAQMLAGQGLCAAAVLVAPLPTGRVPAPPKALPYYLRVAPRVLCGLPFLPSRAAARRLALHDLPRAEQEQILDGYVPESGLAYRDLVFGKARVKNRSVTCPVLVLIGGADRLIPQSTARGTRKKYRGRLIVFPGYGHWLIAPSRTSETAGAILAWLEKRLGLRRHRRRGDTRATGPE
jgi:pimeloyl-ACP methyl ester carboxylesterase